MKASVIEHLEKHGVFSRRACDRYPQISFSFGPMQDLDAKREHRRASRSGKESALVDCANVSDELRLYAPRLVQKFGEPAKQFLVGDRSQ